MATKAQKAYSSLEKGVNLHFRRFEFKYHLPRAVADRIIPQMMNYMNWDEYSGDEGYEVNSLYMESPEWRSYHEKIDGVMNRKKVRIRSYEKSYDDNSPIFFEIKRRSGEVILKDRMIVKGECFRAFIDDPFCLCGFEEYQGDFLNEFLYEISFNRMRPFVLVNYRRKAFFSKFDKRFRVTFDFDLNFGKPNGASFDTEYKDGFHNLVVMEVKFNGAMPRWFHDIIEMYSLTKLSFSKYCAGVEASYGIPAYF